MSIKTELEKAGIKLNLTCPICNKEIFIDEDLAIEKQRTTHLSCFKQKEVEKMLDEHRKKSIITCNETCFCWDIEAFLNHKELK